MASLKQQLADARAEREAKRDPAATALMNRATEDLRTSGILERVAKVGDTAPQFARPGLDGKTARLRTLLKRGPVVVSFFRGRW